MSKPDESVIVSAFSEEQVERLTGVSKRQLRYWDRTDFFAPAFGDEDRRLPYSRLYSFRDVASLRVLNELRNRYSVPLQHLRKVALELSHLSENKWIRTELFVLNKRVVFVEPGTKKYREIVSGQYVIGIPLRSVLSDTKSAIESLAVRPKEVHGKIERARNVSHNALVIAGTRIPIRTIKRFAEDGFSVSQIKKEYPTLTDRDIKAAIDHKGDDIAA